MFNNLFRFINPFEVYRPVGNGESVTWLKDRDEKGLVVPGQLGLVSLVTREALEIGDAVMNLRDAHGKNLFVRGGVPYMVYITTSTPQIDPDGFLIGWRHTLARELPRDFEAQMVAILTSQQNS